ncbi:hypothetical protein HYALB_00008414 [Hymenoscyphus albidus]|uniref:NAD(P)-binding protein n=1 Tax=Hymenoscyphus albidus TaxID=595503 RepID=A0A9N9LM67_9HELO|nr:hypothetical protein HYALB_00008414 [Hymenoscyphus albidus]
MQPPFPSFTPTWHNDTYPAIDPTKKELSQTGKTVIITGAGSGTGRQTAIAFATAGAKHLVLIGRTEADLIDTQKLIPAPTTSAVFPVSVLDEEGIKRVATEVGSWNVLIMGAAHIPKPASTVNTELADWWLTYETNVKSIVIAAQAFFPIAAPEAAVYAITAGAMALPPAYTPNLSGYLSSKAAQVKVMESFATENPELFICTLHPSMLDTKVFRSSAADASKLPMDTYDLEAHFMVWLTQPKKQVLAGTYGVGQLGRR